MENKENMVIGVAQLLAAIGVTTLVAGAITIVKPAKMGAIKQIAVGTAGLAIGSMATDAVTEYVGKEVEALIATVKGIFQKKSEVEETSEEVVEAEAQA
jgi:hypothetical protein